MEKFDSSHLLSIYLCGYDSQKGSEFLSVLHTHPFYQMNLVQTGEADFETSSGVHHLHPGDIVMTPPGQPHTLRLKEDGRFRDYSFKFYLPEQPLNMPKNIIVTEPELREQQLEWITALGGIFRSAAPPEFFQRSKEFSLSPETPGIELLQSLLWGFCLRISNGESAAESWLLRKLKLLVQSRHGEPLSVEECAAHLHCSAGHLLTLIRAETGMTTKSVIDRERLRFAKRMLAYSDISISHLAAKMKFKDLIYFDRFFRKYTGEPPREYRKRKRLEGNN